jgi:hypothetical protein
MRLRWASRQGLEMAWQFLTDFLSCCFPTICVAIGAATCINAAVTESGGRFVIVSCFAVRRSPGRPHEGRGTPPGPSGGALFPSVARAIYRYPTGFVLESRT